MLKMLWWITGVVTIIYMVVTAIAIVDGCVGGRGGECDGGDGLEIE